MFPDSAAMILLGALTVVCLPYLLYLWQFLFGMHVGGIGEVATITVFLVGAYLVLAFGLSHLEILEKILGH